MNRVLTVPATLNWWGKLILAYVKRTIERAFELYVERLSNFERRNKVSLARRRKCPAKLAKAERRQCKDLYHGIAHREVIHASVNARAVLKQVRVKRYR